MADMTLLLGRALTNTIERFFLMKLEGYIQSLSHHSHKFNFPSDYFHFLAIKTHAHNDNRASCDINGKGKFY